MPRIKKEDEFYTLLKEFAALIGETAGEYAAIVHDFPNSMSRIPQMKVYETNCDERVKNIMNKLYTSFITPIDREDLSDLALALDNVTDSMYSVTMRLDLFNIQDMRVEAEQFADLTVRAAEELKEMMDRLPKYDKEPEPVMEKATAINALEDEGDTVYQNALRRLFHDEAVDADGKYAVTWLRIFDRMEMTMNAYNDVAAIIRNVLLKNA